MFINPKIVFKDKPSESSDSNPDSNFFCTLCEFAHISQQDFALARDWDGVCQECYLTFVESRRKLWKEGWRPDKETLDEYIYKRHEILASQEKSNELGRN